MEEIVWAGRTISELSQELGVAPKVLRKLIRLMERAEATAAGAVARLAPESRVRELAWEVEELRRLLGRQAVKLQILEKKGDGVEENVSRSWTRVRAIE
jgi:predicted transcriptional regulator